MHGQMHVPTSASHIPQESCSGITVPNTSLFSIVVCHSNRASLPQVVLPEYGLHAFLSLLFLLTFQLMCVLINVPLLAYNLKKYVAGMYR